MSSPVDDPVTVRVADLASPDDAAAIVAMTDMYARSEMGGGEPLPDAVAQRLVPAMRAHGGVEVLLAEDEDGDPVGICTLVEKFSTFDAAPTMNVHDLAVVEQRRSEGIGARMLAVAEALARERGCSRINLEVLEVNPAKRLYARMGFEAKSEYWVKRLRS